MGLLGLFHHHPRHRARQMRWVLPVVALVLLAGLGTLAVQYRVSDQAVSTEFFRAHKTISHTGELLRRGTVIGAVVLLVVSAITLWAFRLTHRIVRPVHRSIAGSMRSSGRPRRPRRVPRQRRVPRGRRCPEPARGRVRHDVDQGARIGRSHRRSDEPRERTTARPGVRVRGRSTRQGARRDDGILPSRAVQDDP